MALVLTLACPLVYWVMFEHRTLRSVALLLLVAIVLVTIILAYVELKRAYEKPHRYHRRLPMFLAALGGAHLILIGLGALAQPSAFLTTRVIETDHQNYRVIQSPPDHTEGSCTLRPLY